MPATITRPLLPAPACICRRARRHSPQITKAGGTYGPDLRTGTSSLSRRGADVHFEPSPPRADAAAVRLAARSGGAGVAAIVARQRLRRPHHSEAIWWLWRGIRSAEDAYHRRGIRRGRRA